MAWYRAGGGGIPSSLKTDMNAVLNKKFGTSQDYPPTDWAPTVNLMGPLPEKTVSGAIATFADGADAVPLKKCEITLPASLDGYSSVTVHHTDGQTPPVFSEDYTVSLGRTIYGGTVDVVKGQGESLCGKIVFDGSSDENWTAYAAGNGYIIAVADMERGTWYTSELAESYPLPKVPDNNSLGVRIGVNNNGVYVVQANTISGVTDLASFKAYLAENQLTVIYPLDNSETFTFDPVPIDSKLGNNTIWSEQGDTEVTYRADINLALGGQ